MRAAEVVGPYGKLPRPPWGAARSGAFAPAGAREGWESVRRASKRGRGCGSPRRPVGPPRNDRRGMGDEGRGFGPPRSSAPTESSRDHPGERRAAERSRQRGRGTTRNRRRDHQKGKVATTAPAALSEAESAERAAGQMRFLPDDLRVQHGAGSSEVCGRPRPCSGRGCRVSGQDGLGPYPPAARGRREAFFLSTAPPSLSF